MSFCAVVLLAVEAGGVSADDWPEWCGQASRNRVARSEQKLPDSVDCGEQSDAGEVLLQTTKNVKWVAKIGRRTTGSPVVSRGRVFVGTTWEDGKDACFLCFDEKTGGLLGSFICPTPSREDKLEDWSISSSPTIEDDRLYFISPYQEAMCVDLKTLLGKRGSDQPPSASADKAAVSELSLKSIVWRYDMCEKLKAYYHHTASSSVLVHGDYVYVCTGNGRSWVPGRIPYNPLAPSLVVFHKMTGQLIARDDEQIGEKIYRGQYASPSLGMVNGKAQIFFATGDSVCYAFEPVNPVARVEPDRWKNTCLRGPIVYFINVKDADTTKLSIEEYAKVKDKDTGQHTPAEYARSVNLLSTLPKPALPLEFRFSLGVPATTPIDTIPTASVPDVPVLRKIWSFDCIPPAYKKLPFYPRQSKGDGRGHPCDIIGTPVFHNNRVYIAIGGDPNHGGEAKGSVVCIDATQTGDVTEKAKVWSYEGLNQSVSTVAVADGLVFVADNAYAVHCLDADTGRCYWTHPSRQRLTCFSSPLVADGKVFIGKTILSATKKFELRDGIKNSQHTEYSSHSVANGVLYAVIGKRLWAIGDESDPKTAK
jgi:outer membrane protein assembly factor BamB